MSNLSYEMIEGQPGGATNETRLGTAGGGAEGEASTLLLIPGDKRTRKAWMAAVAALLLAGVAAFLSSPRSSPSPHTNPESASSSASGEWPQNKRVCPYM